MRRLARVGVVVFGCSLVAGCFSPLTTLPPPPGERAQAEAGQLADCGSALQLGSYCGPDSRSSVVLPVPSTGAGAPLPAGPTAGQTVGDRPVTPPAEVPVWFPIDVPAPLPTDGPGSLPIGVPTAVPGELPTDEPTLVPIVIPAELPVTWPTALPTAPPAPDDDHAEDDAGRPPDHGADRDDEKGKGEKPDRPKKGKAKGRKGD